MKIEDLALWESFLWVAKEQSFTGAARRLRVGIPLLSKRIARLENTLNVRLLQRSTRKVSLTDEGRSLLPHVSALLEDIETLESRLERADELSGTLRLTCLPWIAHRLLAPAIIKFSELHPKLRFELDVSDHLVDLIDTQTDLGIRIQEPTGADYVFRKLAPNRLVVCASPTYLRKCKEVPKRPSDLKDHPMLTLKVHDHLRFRGTRLRLKDVRGTSPVECGNGSFLTEFVLQGAGIAVRSYMDVRPYLESGQLRELCSKNPLENFRDIYAVVPSRRYLAPRVRAFLDFLCAETLDSRASP